MTIMHYRLLFLVYLFILNLSCKKNDEKQLVLLAETQKEKIQEKPRTLYLPDFGLYLNNWPQNWVLANHGNGCRTGSNSVSFIFGTAYETEGILEIETIGDLGEDYFSTLELKQRSLWDDKKRVDLDLETVDGGKVRLKFLNLNKRHEKWVVENVAFLPPFEDVIIDEVTFPSFPIYGPQKQQRINIIFDFNILSSTRDYQMTFQNQTSRLGVSCSLRNEIKGNVETSIGKSSKRFGIGDIVYIDAKEENVSWKVVQEKGKLVVFEKEHGKTKTLYEIPISEDYDFTFYANAE